MEQNLPPEETLRLGMACGVANAMRGEVGSVRIEDVLILEENGCRDITRSPKELIVL